jgi:hypothetical protein
MGLMFGLLDLTGAKAAGVEVEGSARALERVRTPVSFSAST